MNAFTHAEPARNQQHGQQRNGRDGVGAVRVVEGHQHQHAEQEEQGEPGGHRRARQLKADVSGFAFFNRLAQTHLADHDKAPGRDNPQCRHVQNDFEYLRRHQIVQEHAEDIDHQRRQNTGVRHVLLAHLGHELRRRTAHGHGAQDTTGRVQAGVQAGERCGQDHDVHDAAHVRHAQLREEGDEWTLTRLIGVPRQQQHQQHHGTDVEQTDTPDHAVDGFWHHRLRIFTFTCCGAHQLDGGEGEHDALNQHQRRQQTVREESAVIGYQVEAGGIAIQRLTAAEEDGTHDQEHHDGQHFNQRKPELHLREPLHADHVHGADNRQRAKRKDPLRHIAKRAPVVHIQRNGGDIDDTGHRPVDEVHPARDVSGFFTEEFTGVRDEAAAGRAMQYQLAQRAENEEREDPAHQIDQGESRASHLQTCTRT